MTKLKFFHPKIDHDCIMHSYDGDYLRRIRETFGVTDVWATYSWGFSERTEQEDYDFLLQRVDNFHKEGMKVHAYVQGPNLVYEDFKHTDWFCRDEKGRMIKYHRGRNLTCLNNPGYRQFLLEKIARVCATDVDGMYIDNLFHGQLGVPGTERHSIASVGCHCKHCQKAFMRRSGFDIPRRVRAKDPISAAYLDFRVQTVTRFLKEAADIAHAQGKEIGSNSLDPAVNTRYVYGTDLRDLNELQDYVLFENLTLPNPAHKRNNSYVHALREQGVLTKPTFVLSYKDGIGFDAEFNQHDIDSIFSEAQKLDFFPCIKGSEYFTRRMWHNLKVEKFRTPQMVPLKGYRFRPSEKQRSLLFALTHPFLRLGSPLLNPLASMYWENKFVRSKLSWLERRLLK